jgi:hypothetical protein
VGIGALGVVVEEDMVERKRRTINFLSFPCLTDGTIYLQLLMSEPQPYNRKLEGPLLRPQSFFSNQRQHGYVVRHKHTKPHPVAAATAPFKTGGTSKSYGASIGVSLGRRSILVPISLDAQVRGVVTR